MRSSDQRRGRTGRREGGVPRPDYRRLAVAVEAARIIQEEGLLDYRGAKAKAAERLGLGRNAPLPDNAEIEQALAERSRIFHGESHPRLVAELRRAALEVMTALAEFHPRLVGDVLRGVATDHSSVDLHLFSDTAEAVGATLETLGLKPRTISRRHRMRPSEMETFPGFRFAAHGGEFTSTVFPLRLRGHPPLSPVDGRPMERRNAKELASLLAAASSAV